MNDLVLEDDPILRKKCQPFDFENPQVDPIKLKEELIRAMVKYEGLGISACQIIHMTEETTYMREGCLTFPGLFFPIERAKGINCTFAVDDGKVNNASFVDISAKVFQHEFDHMIGKLYLEYASTYMIRNARKKQRLWKRKRKHNGS